MSAAIDTNILLYASNSSSESFDVAHTLIGRLARGPELLYVFWPIAMGFLRLSTNPAVTDEPLSPAEAMASLSDLIERNHVRTPGEAPGFLGIYRETASVGTRGKDVTDAHIAALMRQHGVGTIYTRDRDFRRFDGIRVEDPFEVAPARR
ncbi:MAG TPA: TA system VapC family ribonuclease toxin [Solirubrobacterales bacterium]|nr:TA system VapC family ribonuclease toxin [Solirubrobacterales bacterium]